MADFDPSSATAVEEPKQGFDPSSASLIQEQPSLLQDIGTAAKNVAVGFVKGLPEMLAPEVQAARDIGKAGRLISDVYGGQPIQEATAREVPESRTFPDVILNPNAPREQRIEAGLGTAAQIASLLLPLHGAIRGRFTPTLSETIFPEEGAAVPETGQGTATLIKPEEVLTQTPQTEAATAVAKEVENASQITSTEGVPVPQVREEMGGEAPLRQQGETPAARQPQTATQAQEVAPTTEPPVAQAEVLSEPIPTETSGISNKAFTQQYGEGAIPSNVGKSPAEWKAFGQEALPNADVAQIITKARANNNLITPEDYSILRAEHERLRVERRASEDAWRADPTPENLVAMNEKSADASDFAKNVMQPFKQNPSDLFRSMQEMDELPMDRFTDYQEMFRDKLGREMSQEESNRAMKMADQTRTQNADYQAANGEVLKRADTEYNRIKTVRPTRTLDDLKAAFADPLGEIC